MRTAPVFDKIQWVTRMGQYMDYLGQLKSKLYVAPMMDWTDRHCRYFMRLLTPGAVLYTEMITADALHHGDVERLLRFDSREHPVALQLGGSDPVLMADAAKMGADAGYDEININVGCPSDRVQSGQFGACLMATPGVVAECVAAMQAAVSIPVTIKSRIGIDESDSYGFLKNFVDKTMQSGCKTYIVHARKAILSGLSPKENRSVPPLIYDRVYRLKADFPELNIIVNGGITTVEECCSHLEFIDGVMIGRRAYQDPWFLTKLETMLGGNPPGSRHDVVIQMIPYIRAQLNAGAELKHIARHMLGLFAGEPGARSWRRHLSEQAHRQGADVAVVEEALNRLPVAA